MGTQLGSFRRVQRAFEERAEDRRFDRRPIEFGRLRQQADFVACQLVGMDLREESAIEVEDHFQGHVPTVRHRSQ